MCKKAVDDSPWLLQYVPDQYKTKEMYDNTVKDNPFSMQFGPDCFVTREWMWMCYDDYYDDDGDHWDDDDEDKFFEFKKLKKPQ